MKANGSNSMPGFDDYDDLDADDIYADPPAGSSRRRAQARNYQPAYEEPHRKPASDREAAFNTLAWLVEGVTGVIEELRNNDLGLDEEFWVHAYAARREGLMAVRAVLDQMIDGGAAQQSAEQERQQRQERRGGINVDF